jgi:hypothetical protein
MKNLRIRYMNVTLNVTQQESLRYYGNATGCIDHVTTENLICHNMLSLQKTIIICYIMH